MKSSKTVSRLFQTRAFRARRAQEAAIQADLDSLQLKQTMHHVYDRDDALDGTWVAWLLVGQHGSATLEMRGDDGERFMWRGRGGSQIILYFMIPDGLGGSTRKMVSPLYLGTTFDEMEGDEILDAALIRRILAKVYRDHAYETHAG